MVLSTTRRANILKQLITIGTQHLEFRLNGKISSAKLTQIHGIKVNKEPGEIVQTPWKLEFRQVFEEKAVSFVELTAIWSMLVKGKKYQIDHDI